MSLHHDLPAKTRILLTAHDLFYRQGIRATAIDRIIADAGVTKVTFYRHFPSKNELILAYLDYRHQRWIDWFKAALARHGNGLSALVPALAEWLGDPEFRGCAFINTVGELASDLPQVVEIARNHKHDMTRMISELIRPAPLNETEAAGRSMAISVAMDGAIVHAQYESDPAPALEALKQIVAALTPPAA